MQYICLRKDNIHGANRLTGPSNLLYKKYRETTSIKSWTWNIISPQNRFATRKGIIYKLVYWGCHCYFIQDFDQMTSLIPAIHILSASIILNHAIICVNYPQTPASLFLKP